MNNYRPPKQIHWLNFLWESEWNNHDHEYSEFIYRVQPGRFANDLNRQFQLAFFHDIIVFYKT
jgi:hypothetical protein